LERDRGGGVVLNYLAKIPLLLSLLSSSPLALTATERRESDQKFTAVRTVREDYQHPD